MGLRCSGKSTVGALLAGELALRLVDLDDAVAASSGAATAGWAWRTLGERRFRAAEVRELGEALEGPPAVIALGGGTPAIARASEMLRRAQEGGRAVVVYLRASPITLRRRLEALGDGADRPSLTGADPAEEMEAVFRARDALYRTMTDHIAVADSLTPQQLSALIVGLVREPGA